MKSSAMINILHRFFLSSLFIQQRYIITKSSSHNIVIKPTQSLALF
jgi:hypothetical protein